MTKDIASKAVLITHYYKANTDTMAVALCKHYWVGADEFISVAISCGNGTVGLRMRNDGNIIFGDRW